MPPTPTIDWLSFVKELSAFSGGTLAFGVIVASALKKWVWRFNLDEAVLAEREKHLPVIALLQARVVELTASEAKWQQFAIKVLAEQENVKAVIEDKLTGRLG